jgi:hypothetical protein
MDVSSLLNGLYNMSFIRDGIFFVSSTLSTPHVLLQINVLKPKVEKNINKYNSDLNCIL